MPIIFREMISSEAIARDNPKTLAMARFDPIERPIIQQIFGADPDRMARSAAMIMETFAPDGIDINMGCPVRKLTSNFNGAALMNDVARAAAIVTAVKRAVASPVSVKIRIGWNDPKEGREFAKRLEGAGADLITVHGRTKCQAYSGSANWNEIGEIKKRLSIPVLANGDIVDGPTAQQALSLSRCNGVMIARGALGNPWVFTEIAHALRHDRHGEPRESNDVGVSHKISIILQHAQLMLDRYGNAERPHHHARRSGQHGIILFRKHLLWYFKRTAGAKELRARLLQTKSFQELSQILTEYAAVRVSTG